jgi:hypothetical protein
MDIMHIAEILAAAGLGAPSINALIPDENNYEVLLIQPQGEIEASTAGVRNRNHNLAHKQFGQFLALAQEARADLVITPEYSMPWVTLVSAIKEGTVPERGKLWVLGCESIKYSELETLKLDLASTATVLYEKLSPGPGRFMDPLAYVFLAPLIDGTGATRPVVLVQFKTHPMGDESHFEINSLQRGTRIYKFGGAEILTLISLICSDSFAFKDSHADAIYHRALVLHLQLNPKPRQTQFRQYRDRLFKFAGDETELICVNWASDVHEWCGKEVRKWNNLACSAWYLRPSQFDARDETLFANHQRGLYYTWLDSLRSHALFFNYEPAVYLITATKVAHIGVVASVSRRRGPQLTRAYVWNEETAAWSERVTADDGFSRIVKESGDAKDELKRLAADNPVKVERILALCAGKIGHKADWFNVRTLDSYVIDLTEVVLRLTFCQDTDERARAFRVARLKRCGSLWKILKTDNLLPAALADFKQGFRFEWSQDFPHQNAISNDKRRATVIYMGEESDTAQVEAVAKRAAEFIHRGYPDPNESHNARQRLAVWRRDDEGTLVLYDPYRHVRYDKPGDTSEFNIGREE